MPVILFILNPGSTSTKIALFSDLKCLYEKTVRHSPAELAAAGSLAGQLPIRRAAVETALGEALAENRLETSDLTAFVGRGGLIRSGPSGTYQVNQAMLDDLQDACYGEHASNLGAIIAADLADRYGKKAYVADPPTVDEMNQLSRYTGLPQIRRISAFHALNHKEVARMAAAELGLEPQQCDLVVAHLGGGISVGAHQHGRVIDVNNALEEGPFSPERAGSLPTMQLVDLCFSGCLDKAEIMRLLVGQGGLVAYTGTNDCRLIEELAADRPDYQELLAAMAYQVAKSIGAMAVSLGRRPDAIVLTGGLIRSSLLAGLIRDQVSFLAKVLVFPGEYELIALARGTERILDGTDACLEYYGSKFENGRGVTRC